MTRRRDGPTRSRRHDEPVERARTTIASSTQLDPARAGAVEAPERVLRREHLPTFQDDWSAFCQVDDMNWRRAVGLGEVTDGDCDRDGGAYGPNVVDVLADLESDLEIADVEHVACSGAVSANLFSPHRIRVRGDDVIVDPQLDAVGAERTS